MSAAVHSCLGGSLCDPPQAEMAQQCSADDSSCHSGQLQLHDESEGGQTRAAAAVASGRIADRMVAQIYLKDVSNLPHFHNLDLADAAAYSQLRGLAFNLGQLNHFWDQRTIVISLELQLAIKRVNRHSQVARSCAKDRTEKRSASMCCSPRHHSNFISLSWIYMSDEIFSFQLGPAPSTTSESDCAR